ncbi:leucine-rich PPR motif-containing protein, mitochondrial [Octopus sinensis]|uniref:Leucine-rich PPR motif-containing protein, mitochondrial n=1 Tax=Octopus sinensis TaxID=2607531 RepID=A0A6P7SX31_9MOLL|nr:leucine-rich PPR motif-containing protein, mitochondrial [Octopus sinensis]
MASLVRAARICRILPSFTSHFTRQSPLTRSVCLERQTCFPKNPAIFRCASTQAEAAPLVMNNDFVPTRRNNTERLMVSVETNLYRFGRVSYNQVRDFMDEINKAGTVTSAQALLLLRSLGSSLFDEHPKFRSETTLKTWDKFQEYGLQFDVTHYNALLRNHLQNNHSFEPSEFLAVMEKNQIEPNRVTYQNLISQYCEMGDIEGASKILEHMKSSDLPIGEQVFNSLITGHFRAGDPESAKEILNVMKTAGLEPSCDTYVALACGYIEQGQGEHVEKILQEAEDDGILVRPFVLLRLIFEMAQNNQQEMASKLIPKLSSFRSWNQDAISWINQLICFGHDQIAFEVFTAMPKPLQKDDHELQLGRFFIRALVKNFALELINRIAAENIPVRKHFFWPAFCQFSESNNKEGFLKAFKTMLDMFESEKDTAVMHEYIIPGMVQLGFTVDEMQQAFNELGITDSDFNCYYFSYLLEHTTFETAIAFVENKTFIPVIGAIKPYALKQFKKTADWKSFLKIIRLCKEMMAPTKPLTEMINSWIILVVRAKNWKSLEAILDEMKLQNFSLDSEFFNVNIQSVPEALQAKFDDIVQSEESSSSFDRLLAVETLYSSELPCFRKFTNKPTFQLYTSQLQDYVTKTNNNTAKKLLLVRYCATGDVPHAEKLKASLDKEGFFYPPLVLRQLIFLNAMYKKDLKEALKYLTLIEDQFPDYTDYTRALLNVAALMINEGKVSDALALLEKYAEKHGKYMTNAQMSSGYAFERDCCTVVFDCAKTQDLSATKNVLTTLFKLGYIKPATYELLESMMKGYIEREDGEQVLEALDWLITEYSRAPSVDSILQLFITKEDPEKLQKAIDRVTPIHGELNVLHQLMVNLVECGHYKKAKKILETPGIRAAMIRLKIGCETLISKEKISELEQLVEMTKNLFGVDRDEMLFQLIRGYVRIHDYKKAKNVLTFFEEEGISPSGRTLRYLANVLENIGDSVDFTVPTVVDDKAKQSTILEDDILRHVKENRMKTAKEMIRRFESSGDKVSEELLMLMAEFLFRVNRKTDLGWVLQELGSRGSVENLLLLKSKGIDTGNDIVSKNVFSAYVVSDRSDELLEFLGKNPDMINSFISVKGMAHLKEKDPEKLVKLEELAYRCEPRTKKSILWNIWQTHFLENPYSSSASVILERNSDLLQNSSILGLCRKAVQEKREDVFKVLPTIFTQLPTLRFIYGQHLFIPVSQGDVEGSLAIIKTAEEKGIPATGLNQNSVAQLEALLKRKQIPIPWKNKQQSQAVSSQAADTTSDTSDSSSSSDGGSSSSDGSTSSDSSDSDSDNEKKQIR